MRPALRACLLGLALLPGCAPEPFDCARQVALTEATAPVGVAGLALRASLTSTSSTCVSDALRVTAELFDPENLPLAVTVESLARTREGFAAASLSFRPRRPGTHLLRATFEPSLGVAQALVSVAASELGPALEVPVPAGVAACAHGPWPLGDDAVACERRDAGVIELSQATGEVTRFEGQHLVVAGATLWSLTADGTLQRRQWRDGGAALTAEAPGFLLADTPALHGDAVALRWRADATLALVRGTGALAVTSTDAPYTAPPALAALDADGGVHLWSSPWRLCARATCEALEGLLALEPTVTWRQGPLRAQALTTAPAPQWPPRLRPAPLELPATGFERWPAWLDPAQVSDQREVFVVTTPAGLELVAAPPGPRPRVGQRHLVLPATPHAVHLQPWLVGM